MTAPQAPESFEAMVQRYMHQMGAEQGRAASLQYAPPAQTSATAAPGSSGAEGAALGLKLGMKLAEKKAAESALNAGASQAASTAAYNQAAGEASQLAWNAGANAATGEAASTAAPTILGNAGAMGAGPIAAIIAGTALGGKSAYDLIRGKNDTSLPGKIGRVTLGVATGGLSELARALMGDKDRWKEEQDNRRRLIDKGYVGWDQLDATMPKLTGGRSIADLIAIEEANAAAGKHSNVAFAKSRDVKDLKAEDIWGYSAFGDKFGNDWLGKYTEGQRRGIAQALLDNGAITEGRGQIKINSNADLDAKLAGLLANDGKGPFAQNATPAATRSTTRSPGIGKDGRPVSYGRR